MAASNNNGGGNGRKNYYSVAYGKFSTKIKEPLDGYTEILEADLKAKIQEVEQVDLRNKYLNKGTGDYPIVVYYDSLTGNIMSQEKVDNDNGVFLHLTVQDTDGDTSIVQMKFYSKYAENLLNRLLNTDPSQELTLTPYAVPNSSEIDGKKVKFYTQGISVKVAGEKVTPKYDNENKDLPPTAQVKVAGKTTTSRDARLDFLYEKFLAVFKPSEGGAPKQETAKVDETKSFVAETSKSDLPF